MRQALLKTLVAAAAGIAVSIIGADAAHAAVQQTPPAKPGGINGSSLVGSLTASVTGANPNVGLVQGLTQSLTGDTGEGGLVGGLLENTLGTKGLIFSKGSG